MKIIVVVPTIREEHIKQFLSQWDVRFSQDDCQVIIVEDHQKREFDLSKYPYVEHFCHEDIEADLGDRSWIIARRGAEVRSYGLYKAWQANPEMILFLDDDCLPLHSSGKAVDDHYDALYEPQEMLAWQSPLWDIPTRGMPYFNVNREINQKGVDIALNHGLWENHPDLDAVFDLVKHRMKLDFSYNNIIFPKGIYFPCCAMNVAFRPELAPTMYQLLMGGDYFYARFGDIWSGVMMKKICDHLGLYVRSGSPLIAHTRASNVWSNLRLESRGIEENETFWEVIDNVELTGDNPTACYREIVEKADFESCMNPDYAKLLKEAMTLWIELYE